MNIRYAINQQTGVVSYVTGAGGSGGGSGDGLSPAQVDALIRGSVQDWAETGNTDAIPVAKIPNLNGNKITSGTIGDNRIPASIARDSEVNAAIASAVDGLQPELPTYNQSTEEVLHSRAGTLYWDPINEVPIAGAENHVLTKTGSGDTAYAFRSVEAIPVIAEIETRGTTNASSIADLNTRLNNVEDLQSVTVSTSGSYQTTLNSQVGSAKPLLLVVDTAISGNRGGSSYSWPAGSVIYFPPTSDSAEALFTLPQATGGGSGGLNQSQVDARVQAGVLDWAETGNSDALPVAKIPNLNADKITSGTVPDNRIPSSIARDTEVTTAISTAVDPLTARVEDIERDALIEPDYWLSTPDARTFVVHIHAAAVPRDANRIRLTLAGSPFIVNLVAGDTDYSFNVTAVAARNTTSNLRGATTVSLNLDYLNSTGTAVATQSLLLRVLAAQPDQGLTQTQVDARVAAGTSARTVEIQNARDTSVYLKMWTGTQTQYDALAVKDANTLYIVPSA